MTKKSERINTLMTQIRKNESTIITLFKNAMDRKHTKSELETLKKIDQEQKITWKEIDKLMKELKNDGYIIA